MTIKKLIDKIKGREYPVLYAALLFKERSESKSHVIGFFTDLT